MSRPLRLLLPFRSQTFLAGLGLAMSCSACASLPDGSLAGTNIDATPPVVASAGVVSGGSFESAGQVRLGRRAAGPIQTVSHEAHAPNCPPDAITATPAEPRFPVAGPNPYGVGMPFYDEVNQPSPYKYPDEYLCDGGDREWPVHYGEDTRLGLDTEDTVAEYVTHLGKEGLTKSNRTCVYAPRFASVRSVSLPHEEGTYRELASVNQAGIGSEVRTRLAPNMGGQRLSAGDLRIRSRASGLESEQLPSDVGQQQRPQMHDKVLNTFQSLAFFESGTLEQSDIARLQLGLRAALVWSREQSPVIQGKVDAVATGLSEVRATALTVIEHDDTPGVLRIVKVADKQAAEIGDVITFSIRYDNFGPNPVGSVRIVDNLTPRLEYVEDSATCDVAGRLVVQDNGEGSLILIWELAEPVAPRSGGVVTFQARVR